MAFKKTTKLPHPAGNLGRYLHKSKPSNKKLGSTLLKPKQQKNKLGSATVTLSRRKARKMQTPKEY